MKLLIDGYNLLKWLVGASQASTGELKEFVTILKNYAQRAKHSVIIIFDGVAGEDSYEGATDHYCVQLYTGSDISADEYIIEYLASYSERPIGVVTSDRNLSRSAKQAGAIVLSIHEFWDAVMKKLKKQESSMRNPILYKTSLQVNPALDELMYQQKTDICKSNDEQLNKKNKINRRLSKDELKKAQVLKKL